MATVISVENLSKAYRLGQIGTGTFTNDLKVWWAKVRGKPNPISKIGQPERGNRDGETIWALKDVSFTVEQGEVLGVIGRNGAGKSTLLKILSRVTAPTSGKIRVKGRVASLLEVGTGFHPELTGRENIYLNGAILGMTKQEVTSKFDEIVDFAGVEKFIDTPVKRYSSGMYVRLAFAVAAHLDPEILVVDEVLAVGDAEFQKKCFGKMRDVTTAGRTIIFVSHNMQAIQALCPSCMFIHKGRVEVIESTPAVITQYLNTGTNTGREVQWSFQNAPGNDDFRLRSVKIFSNDKHIAEMFDSRNDIFIEFCFDNRISHSSLCVGFDLLNSQGETVLRSYQTDMTPGEWPIPDIGWNRWICKIPAGLLNGNTYYVNPRIGLHNISWIVYEDSVIKFNVQLNHSKSPFWTSIKGSQNRPGAVSPILNWFKDYADVFKEEVV